MKSSFTSLLAVHVKGPLSYSIWWLTGLSCCTKPVGTAWLCAAFFLICECAKMPGTPKRHWTQAVANNSLELLRNFASLTPSSTSCRKFGISVLFPLILKSLAQLKCTIFTCQPHVKHWPPPTTLRNFFLAHQNSKSDQMRGKRIWKYNILVQGVEIIPYVTLLLALFNFTVTQK